MTGPEIALIGLAVSVLATAVGAGIGYGALRQRVDSNAEATKTTLTRHDAEIKAAAAKADEIPALIQSINHLGQTLSENVKHVTERMDISNNHIREQLADIKGQLKTPRRRSTPPDA